MSLDETVIAIMNKDVDTIDLDRSVKDAAAVLAKKRTGCVIVVRDKIVTGIITEQDVVSKVTAGGVDPSKVLVRDVMSSPVISVMDSATLKEAAAKMSEYEIRRLVVVNATGALSGLISAEDLARWLVKHSDYDDVALKAIAQMKEGSSGSPYQ